LSNDNIVGVELMDGFDSVMDMFMQATLSVPVTASFLSRPLSTLTPDQLLALLTYLIKHFRSNTIPDESSTCMPRHLTISQLVTLTSALLDTKSVTLIMSPSLHPIVLELRQHCLALVGECREMETLTGILKDVMRVDDAEYLRQRVENKKKRVGGSKSVGVVESRYRCEVDQIVGAYGVERVQWW
jgi:hypothetical protein